ncbi:MAG TPA: DUF308 domain-containing protein [Acidimicrobiales bacterium]
MSDFAVADARARIARATSGWWLFLALGVLSAVVGLLLLFDLAEAVRALALFVAFGLIVEGLGELLAMGRYRTPLSMLAGAVLVVGGVLAVAWPGITLWALAVIAGVDLLIHGAARVAGALDRSSRPEGWRWILAGGVVSLVAGVLALAWPAATVLVLAIVLGVRLLAFGLAEIAFAFTLREVHRAAF